MQVSIGIYALICIFLFIVFPGFISRRFYYNGEFSKQINWSNNLLSNFSYSFIVGLISSIIYIFILNSFKEGLVNIDEILNNFDLNYVSSSTSSLGHNFDGFSQSFYQIYLPYISLLYFGSAVIGYCTSKLIQILGFDSRFKILRYSNNWHYLFSGKIMKLGNLKKNEQNSGLDIQYTYLDVLVSDTSTTLYSGLYGDYELNHIDLNKLEKLHLYKAKKYKKMDNGETILVEIPGDVFTIMSKNIININCTYIPMPKSVEKDENQIFNNLKVTLMTVQLFKWFVFVIFTFILFVPLKGLDFISYNALASQSIVVKFLCVFGLNTSFGLITPFQIKEESKKNKFNGWANYILQILLNLVVFGLIYYLFV